MKTGIKLSLFLVAVIMIALYFPVHVALAHGMTAASKIGSTINEIGDSQRSELVSITVAPAAVSISIGQTRQFTAMGIYDDKSIVDITSLVTWTSSNQSVAIIETSNESNPGLVSGLAAGATTITAAQGKISAATKLTVTSVEETVVPSQTEPTNVSTIPSEGPKPTNAMPPPIAPQQQNTTASIINWSFIGGITVGIVALVLVLLLAWLL